MEQSTRTAQEEIPPQLALFRLATGYYFSCAVYAAAKLGVADLIAQGTRHFESIASATGTHAPSLRRMLRLLATAGVFTEDNGGNFNLTGMSECLRANVPGSMRAAMLLFGGETQQAWGDLLYSINTGKPTFEQMFGAPSFAYMDQHPEFAANFDQAMADLTKQTAVAVAAAYDFSGMNTIVDVGGGNGALLAGILKSNPSLRGILFDRPGVVERAKPSLAERCEAIGGDFFESVPTGADAYLLKHVIHDWDDERSLTILKNCHRAMPSSGRLLIVEGVYPPRVDTSDVSRGAASNDVNMLVCSGGRQRSEQEFRSLFSAAGFGLSRIVPTRARAAVIEGRKL